MADDLARLANECQASLGQRCLHAHDAALAVEAMERPRQIIDIARDALRCIVRCRC